MGSLVENELARLELQELYASEDFRQCPEIRERMEVRHGERMEELCPALESVAAQILQRVKERQMNVLEHARTGAFEGTLAGIVMSHVRQTYPEEVVQEDPLQSLQWLRQQREKRQAQASGR